jgi:hypothetical protein
MLQSKEAVISQDGSVRMSEDSEDTAFVGRLMVVHDGLAA